jgi:hypothetical protein
MRHLRDIALVNGRALLTFVLAAIAMQALLPAGLMIAPAQGHGAQIILCPQTHPLARAAAAGASARVAAIHAAMGHGPMDHAAMGHAPASRDDPAPDSTTASSGQSCAFAGAGALAGLLPEHGSDFVPPRTGQALPPAPLQTLRLPERPRLRPPLRAPPVLI